MLTEAQKAKAREAGEKRAKGVHKIADMMKQAGFLNGGADEADLTLLLNPPKNVRVKLALGPMLYKLHAHIAEVGIHNREEARRTRRDIWLAAALVAALTFMLHQI